MPYDEAAAQIKMAVKRWYEAGFSDLEQDFANADSREWIVSASWSQRATWMRFSRTSWPASPSPAK
jgi:hypothetical protein